MRLHGSAAMIELTERTNALPEPWRGVAMELIQDAQRDLAFWPLLERMIMRDLREAIEQCEKEARAMPGEVGKWD